MAFAVKTGKFKKTSVKILSNAFKKNPIIDFIIPKCKVLIYSP
jgi:hypothetical protein